MKRSAKSLIISFSAVGLFFLWAGFTIHSQEFHQRLIGFANRVMKWKIAASETRLSLLRGNIELSRLDVVNPKGTLHVTADHVTLQISPVSLIRGKLIIPRLEVDRPVVDLRKLPPASAELKDVLKIIYDAYDRSLILQNLIVDEAKIHGLTVIQREGKTLQLKRAELHVAPTLLRQMEIEAKLADGSELLRFLRKAAVKIVLKKDGLTVKEADLELARIRLRLSADLKGTLDKGSVQSTIAFEAPTVLSDTLHARLNADLSQKILKIKKLDADLGQAVLNATGTFDLVKKAYDIDYHAKDLPLEAIFQKMKGSILPPAKGIAAVQAKAVGVLPDIKSDAKAAIRNFRHGPLASRLADGTITFRWPVLSYEAFIKPSADGQIRGVSRGDVSFRPVPGQQRLQAFPGKVSLKLDGALLQDIVPELGVTGKIDGHLDVAGVPNETTVKGGGHAKITQAHWALGPMDTFETDVMIQPGGRVAFSQTAFKIPNLEEARWPGTVQLDASGEENVTFSGQPMSGLSVKGTYGKQSKIFRIESLQIRRDQGDLNGSLEVVPGGRINARLEGQVNLEWLPYVPEYFRDGRGLARVDLQASGLFRDPQVRGRIEFLGDELALRGIRQDVTDLKGSLVLSGNDIVTDLTGQVGDGVLHTSGRMRLVNWKPQEFDLKLRGSNLSVTRPNTYRLDFDADVTLKGQLPSPVLSGKIDIVDGRYNKDFVIRGAVGRLFEENPEDLPGTLPLSDMKLDLVIRNSGELEVKNNVAEINLRSNLIVQGTRARPQIRGAMAVTEGIFHYLGDDFIINEGRLEFLNPMRGEPYLTLSAEQDIPPDFIVHIDVRGYLSNLEVALRSTPALPREDIISLISAGETREQLRESGRSRTAASTNILGGEIASILERPIARRTGLDIFRLEASESGRLSKISVGKNVTDRLTLEVRNDFDPDSPERSVQANYYLTDNLLLKGFRSWTRTKDDTVPRFQLNVSFRFRLF